MEKEKTTELEQPNYKPVEFGKLFEKMSDLHRAKVEGYIMGLQAQLTEKAG